MSIVRTDVPMTAKLCDDTILALTEKYPFCRSELLAITAFERPIRTLVIGNGPRRVLYAAAFHANEWITAPVILKFVEDFADIPFPDGWKANLLGVDLNLQYPAGWLQAREIKFSQGFDRPAPRDFVGRAPLNQPESRAIADYTEAVDPALVLAYHTQGKVIYWQFEDVFVPGARELGERMAEVSGYALDDTPYESAFAGYKDWFIKYFRRPGYTIEVGEGVNPLPLSQFDEIYRAQKTPLRNGFSVAQGG